MSIVYAALPNKYWFRRLDHLHHHLTNHFSTRQIPAYQLFLCVGAVAGAYGFFGWYSGDPILAVSIISAVLTYAGTYLGNLRRART